MFHHLLRCVVLLTLYHILLRHTLLYHFVVLHVYFPLLSCAWFYCTVCQKQNRALLYQALRYQAIAITFDRIPYGYAADATPTVWLRCSCYNDCVAACLQEEFAGCCSQACLEAPRLLRPPKQAGYYGNWTTYRYQLYAASVTLSG